PSIDGTLLPQSGAAPLGSRIRGICRVTQGDLALDLRPSTFDSGFSPPYLPTSIFYLLRRRRIMLLRRILISNTRNIQLESVQLAVTWSDDGDLHGMHG
ncbi:MAG: hypothetical protein EBZ48_13155, partial [Proteobacteria bacterium]|nr:hypothetical protein [Pseudomonadota bacterium]